MSELLTTRKKRAKRKGPKEDDRDLTSVAGIKAKLVDIAEGDNPRRDQLMALKQLADIGGFSRKDATDVTKWPQEKLLDAIYDTVIPVLKKIGFRGTRKADRSLSAFLCAECKRAVKRDVGGKLCKECLERADAEAKEEEGKLPSP